MAAPPLQHGRHETTASVRAPASNAALEHDRDPAWNVQQLRELYTKRAARKPQPHELDFHVALEAFLLSLRSFPKAAMSPYTLNKLTKAAVPILGLCALIAALGQVVLLPLTILSWLVSLLMRRNGRAVRQSMHSGLLGSIGMLSVLAMTVMRNVLHKPIFKVFIHTLRDVNPALAQQLEATRPLPASPMPTTAARQQQRQHTQRLPGPPWLTHNRVLRALALSLLTRYWRRIPVAHHFAAPVMLFFAAERLLGTNRAAMLGGLALWPPLAPWIVAGLDLWRTGHFVAPELLSDYIAHRIPGPQREEFLRTNEVAIFCYIFPQLLLFNIPVIGPLLFLPASAAAAYLCSFLDSLPKNKQFQFDAGAERSALKTQ